MQLPPEILPKLIDGYTANIIAYAVLLASVATITMALLELLKAVLRLRLIYHKSRVRKWLNNNTECYRELLVLAVAEVNSSDALFDQPTEKMMGQIQSAANVVLDFPNLYPKIYEFLTDVPVSQAAKDETGADRPKGVQTYSDADIWRKYANSIENGTEAENNESVRQATRARARLTHFVMRKLDAFQTRTEYLWARINQIVSVIGAAVFIIILLDQAKFTLSPVQTIIISGFGGMIAPFAKDVISALSGLRTRG